MDNNTLQKSNCNKLTKPRPNSKDKDWKSHKKVKKGNLFARVALGILIFIGHTVW